VAHTSIDFEFVPFNGKQYLKYIRTETSYQDINIETQAVVNTADLYLEFMVNKIQIEGVKQFKRRETMNKYKNLDSQVGKYNAAFWQSYNMIKTTPHDEKLIKDLEKEVSLREQFINQNRQ